MTEPAPNPEDSPRPLMVVRRTIRDPLFRRTFMASLFAAAFVWVAVDAFHVDTDVVWRYFLLSITLVAVMMAGALLVALVIALVRRMRGRTGKPEEGGER